MYYTEDSGDALNVESLFIKTKHAQRVDIPFLQGSSLHTTYAAAGSCNGFVCLITSYTVAGRLQIQNPIHLLNPITNQRFLLPPFTLSLKKKGITWCCGFGFDDSRCEYKFVLVAVVQDNVMGTHSEEVQVHTLGSKSWKKKLCRVPACLCRSNQVVSEAFVNGSFHWCCGNGKSIVSFNLRDEEFGYIQPPNIKPKWLWAMEKDLACIVRSDQGPGDFDIWVMKEYNVRESWVKLFTIEEQVLGGYPHSIPRIPRVIKVCNNGELLLISLVGRDSCVNSYNTVTRRARRLWTNMSLLWTQVHIIVGSILPLKEAFSMDCERERTISYQ